MEVLEEEGGGLPQSVNTRTTLNLSTASQPDCGSYLRLIDFVSLNLRLKDLLGPVTRVKQKKKKTAAALDYGSLAAKKAEGAHRVSWWRSGATRRRRGSLRRPARARAPGAPTSPAARAREVFRGVCAVMSRGPTRATRGRTDRGRQVRRPVALRGEAHRVSISTTVSINRVWATRSGQTGISRAFV